MVVESAIYILQCDVCSTHHKSRPWLAAQVATITSFWSRRRNEPYHIGKNGVMGEMEGGLKILLRYLVVFCCVQPVWS